MNSFILFGIRYVDCECYYENFGAKPYFVGSFSERDDAEEKLTELESGSTNKYFILEITQGETYDNELLEDLATRRYFRPGPEQLAASERQRNNKRLDDQAISEYYAKLNRN